MNNTRVQLQTKPSHHQVWDLPRRCSVPTAVIGLNPHSQINNLATGAIVSHLLYIKLYAMSESHRFTGPYHWDLQQRHQNVLRTAEVQLHGN